MLTESEILKTIRQETKEKITFIIIKTQEEFAAMLNISIGTLRNWEQGRRKPDGAALSLLKIVSANPEYVEGILLGNL